MGKKEETQRNEDEKPLPLSEMDKAMTGIVGVPKEEINREAERDSRKRRSRKAGSEKHE